ncbi:unnamed protein product [Orchesella dallaii]|uniref:Uncharacterized protein n=1 Tax=Orchesella dallaii TaxID=48710 RepID=A0ABP1S2E6_9HEXA
MVLPIEVQILIVIFGIIVLLVIIYLGYVWYLKKFRGYRFENGVPDVSIMRPSNVGSASMKHFSVAPFRASQINLNYTDKSGLLQKQQRRPHTFPLTSKISNLPEIRVEEVA